MVQVSSILDNILSVESTSTDTDSVATSSSDVTRENKMSSLKPSTPTMASSGGRRRKSDHDYLDFSSFWSKSEEQKKVSNSLVTDKLMEKIISMVIPMNVEDENKNKIMNERVAMQKARPPLSMNTMSKNSIHLTQRLSPAFILIDNFINFGNWEDPFFTVGILMITTHLILNPFLLTVAPILLVLSNVLVPHYLLMYPPDTSFLNSFFEHNPIPARNKLYPYKVPKPVPEFSREFILNLTDLQNHMCLYIFAYDFILWLINGYLFFKDESLSNLVFIGLTGLVVNNLIVLPKLFPFLLTYFPLKLCLIVTIWLSLAILHPKIRSICLDWICNEETRQKFVDINHKVEVYLKEFIVNNDIDEDIEKEVEIFELQKLNHKTKIWELVGFSNDLYPLNSSLRTLSNPVDDYEDGESNFSNIRIARKENVDDIQPPRSWGFVGKKWKIDLDVRGWVMENLILDIVYIDNDEKWVYDYQPDETSNDVFRRRRWIRMCRRKVNKDTRAGENHDDKSTETPNEKENASGYLV
ncbi:uncharacterized protein PRCAT00005980001 [Priceomyces carsonii]|uniref:uncharacterized protein n=1 Tax=Priceomyces carsonii TaxID=28549 RepID=UPI002ED82A7D|nr:unnamed protein product [Priceomyces carsonii]